MRQSKLFFKTQNDFPKDEVAINAKFLIRGNFVEKLMAGVFSYLPLGFRVREKIINIIREEMNAIGGVEMLMPALHPRSVWEPTGRWETLKKIMYQFHGADGKEVGLGTTHEEVIAAIGKNIINSYQDLPLAAYQIQTKFRNEPRAKSGVLRGREFTMKDLYSFHTDEKSLVEFYEKVKNAYKKIFKRVNLKTYITEASGGDFSKEYSHEFMVESGAGEDEIIICRLCNYSQNMEISKHKPETICLMCGNGALEKINAIEVGNIFKLGTKFSEPIGFTYKDKNGENKSVVMGSYGIGVERLMGTVVETHNDERGIIWPKVISPFTAHLLLVGGVSPKLKKFADSVYEKLMKLGVEVLYDDRENLSAGEKFFDADLIGIPYRLVISEKTFLQDKIEIKERGKKETKLVKFDELKKLVS